MSRSLENNLYYSLFNVTNKWLQTERFIYKPALVKFQKKTENEESNIHLGRRRFPNTFREN
jgi:hypothetical protein